MIRADFVKVVMTMDFHQLYYQDPYRSSFEAEVLSCTKAEHGYALILDQTCFYPEGGGQSADRGTIDGIRVTDVQIEDGSVVHTVEKPFRPGSSVTGAIDFDFRFQMMQWHTAEHIVSGLAHNHFGCDNVGFHMSDVTTLDLNRPLTEEQLDLIEREANEVVFSNRPVEYLFPKKEELDSLDYRSKKELTGAVRIVRIPGADDCACCGLHVRSTGEIGLIKILSFMHYKGGVRIEMTSGRDAYRRIAEIYREDCAAARLLSVKPHETADAVSRVLGESAEKDRRIADLNRRYFRMRAESFAPGTDLALCVEEGLNGIEVRKFCDLLVKSGAGTVCAVLCADESGQLRYCIGSGSVDLRARLKELNEALGGRGGGSPQMIQGTFRADAAKASSVLTGFFGPDHA